MDCSTLHIVTELKLSELLGISISTLRRWVKEGNIPKPIKDGLSIVGWNEQSTIGYANLRDIIGFPKEVNPSNINPINSVVRKIKKGLIYSPFFISRSTGVAYPINTGKKQNLPIIRRYMHTILDTFEKPLNEYNLPVGIMVTINSKNTDDITRLIQKIKARIKRLTLSRYCVHAKALEYGRKHGEHYHIMLLIEASQMARTSAKYIKSELINAIEEVSPLIYVGKNKTKKQQAIHVIRNENSKLKFIHHASYLAKKHTKQKGKRGISSSKKIIEG